MIQYMTDDVQACITHTLNGTKLCGLKIGTSFFLWVLGNYMYDITEHTLKLYY